MENLIYIKSLTLVYINFAQQHFVVVCFILTNDNALSCVMECHASHIVYSVLDPKLYTPAIEAATFICATHIFKSSTCLVM